MAEAKREGLSSLFASLAAEVRARRYRRMAAEALEHAASSKDAARKAGHLAMASSCQLLALEIEHSHGLNRPDSERVAEQDTKSGKDSKEPRRA